MLTFIPLDAAASVPSGMVRHGAILGPEGVPVVGELTLDDGNVHAVKSSSDAAGISLMVDLTAETRDRLDLPSDLDPIGAVVLQTCLLPERVRPYLLELELARHRVMLVLNKLEEWQLFDLPAEDEIMRLIDAARRTMTRALVAQREEHPESVAELARSAYLALWLAIEASERLCLLEGARRLPERVSGALFETIVKRLGEDPGGRGSGVTVLNPDREGIVLSTRPAVGCAVPPTSFHDAGKSAVEQACDFVTVPMRWVDLEPSEGEYRFQGTDRWIEWAVRTAKKPVVGGPLVDFRPGCVPDWLYIWENDYETLRELVFEHVKSVVTRYRRTVSRWTAVSGLHANVAFGLSFEQMMDLTRIAVLLIRKLHPQAKVQIEITEPWGEYFTHTRQALPPSLFAEMVAQAGIPVDTVGVRVQTGVPRRGAGARDLGEISAMLDRYSVLDRPIALTAIGVPSQSVESVARDERLSRPGEQSETDQEHQEAPAPLSGTWHDGCTPETQADWLSCVGALALAKPYIQTLCWQELCDSETSPEMPHGGLLSASGQPKPALDRLIELRRVASGEILIDERLGPILARPVAMPAMA